MARFTTDDLRAMLAERILVFDGAMGTAIQERGLGAADFGGADLEGCNENLNLTRPDVVAAIHAGYLEVGADVVETNTFGGTPLVLAEYRLGHQALEINRAAARIAREAAARFDRPGRPRLVAGSMGPTTKTISVTGGVTLDEMCDHYAIQAEGLVMGGADLLLVETAQDTLNVKAALLAIERTFAKLGLRVPIMLSATIEPMGTMLAGQSVEALHTSVEHAPLLSIGLNCATGPDFMTDHVRTLSEMATCAVSCLPNAGLPDEDGRYNERPEGFAAKLARFVEHGWLNVVGGCCGTTTAHIRLLAQLADGKKPRAPQSRIAAATSGVDYLSFDDAKPCIVGERTNVIGSRQFKDLIVGELFEEAAEVGRRQVRGGAHVIDVCLANPDRDELQDMIRFLDFAVKKVRVPLMIDSTDAHVLEEALKRCQGKAIVNSINLEDGEERFEKVVPLIHRYGAAVVIGCIDEDKKSGMAVTRARKLEIARRSFDLLTGKYGLPARDLIFDALVFPCATGDAAYVGSARETIEGVRLLHESLPECRTILGVSNVSFGLPPAGREVLNTVFLHHCLEAGLDLAIVNSEKLARITHVPDVERALAEDLIDNRGADPIKAFADHFKAKATAGGPAKVKAPTESLTLDQRLARCIVEGSKEGLIDDLTLALQSREPLAIINGPLMDGMGEVGKLFAANKLIVAEVLQSAEAMKAAVTFLEKHMKHASDSQKGTILLATVKGDVHDIGKNLVEIILGNNGYRVVNLGIKVPPADLIEASAKHKPDLIGLSGLLVKSAQQMVVTAEDLRTAGVTVPMLVGGAALSEKFTCGKITPAYGATVAYAKDAMSGLDLANRLMDPGARPALEAHLAKRREQLAVDPKPKPETAPTARTVIRHDGTPPNPPDYLPHDVREFDLDTLFAYVNPTMLYGHHLGLRGRLEGLLARGDAKAEELHRAVTVLQDEVVAKKLLRPRALYRFFRAASDGDALLVLSPDGQRVLESIAFPRQRAGEGLCLADFVAPRDAGVADNVCLFVTTAGEGVREIANEWKDRGEYLRSHALQALALETAEAFAELLHQKIREMWGFPDPPSMTHAERWKAKYCGVRVSFGYPACPRLEDQAILWRLLEPERRIGVHLTEGFMMEPEASVSALVFHHPQAKYFSVGEE